MQRRPGKDGKVKVTAFDKRSSGDGGTHPRDKTLA